MIALCPGCTAKVRRTWTVLNAMRRFCLSFGASSIRAGMSRPGSFPGVTTGAQNGFGCLVVKREVSGALDPSYDCCVARVVIVGFAPR